MSEPRTTFTLTEEQRALWERNGLLHLSAAVDSAAAQEMAAAVWRALDRRFGMRPAAPETWTIQAPSGLGSERRAGVFDAMASPTVTDMLDHLLPGGWIRPDHWGSLPLVRFPDHSAEWDVPHAHWHLDSPATPDEPAIARVFVLLAPLRPQGGGTLVVTGSHLLFRRLARREGRMVRSAEAKKQLIADKDWFARLASGAGRGDRIRLFMEEGAVVDDAKVRVVEMTGDAGDIYFMHPNLLHAPSPNVRDQPRLVLTQWIDGKV
jgi:hypothetical protein